MTSIMQLSREITACVTAALQSPQLAALMPIDVEAPSRAQLPDGLRLPLFTAAVHDVCGSLCTIYNPDWPLAEDRDGLLTVPGLEDTSLLPQSDAAQLSASIPLHWSQDSLTGSLQRAGRAVEFAGGVNLPATIVSAPFAVTPFHIEDGCLGALNLLVRGSSKLWFHVPEQHAEEFRSAPSSHAHTHTYPHIGHSPC